MPAKVRIWRLFGPQFFGIGHSSFNIGNLYITWLGNSGGLSASSDSSSVTQSSRSSSTVNVTRKVLNGTWNLTDDRTTFKSAPGQTIDIPIVGEDSDFAFGLQNSFGLRNTDELAAWWQHERGTIGSYKGISIDRNCNAVAAMGLCAANAELYAERPVFTKFAGTNKIIAFANAITARASWLNRLWERQLGLLALVPLPAPTAALPPPNQYAVNLPRLEARLAEYRRVSGGRCARDKMKALGDVLETALDYILETRAARAEQALRILEQGPRPASAPRRIAFVEADPLPDVETLAIVTTRLMTQLEDYEQGRAVR
jgi:hypothetical protein